FQLIIINMEREVVVVGKTESEIFRLPAEVGVPVQVKRRDPEARGGQVQLGDQSANIFGALAGFGFSFFRQTNDGEDVEGDPGVLAIFDDPGHEFQIHAFVACVVDLLTPALQSEEELATAGAGEFNEQVASMMSSESAETYVIDIELSLQDR